LHQISQQLIDDNEALAICRLKVQGALLIC